MVWMIAAGLLMVGTMFTLAARGMMETPDPDACPRCEHEDGLNPQGRHCGNVDSYSGFGSDECHCTSDYHWNYESITTP